MKEVGTTFASSRVIKPKDELKLIDTLSTLVEFFTPLDLTATEEIYLKQLNILCLFLEKKPEAIDRVLGLYTASVESKELWRMSALKLSFFNIAFYYEKTGDKRLREIILKEWRTQPQNERNYFYSLYHFYLLQTINILIEEEETLVIY